MAEKRTILISCEHGGNEVPPDYRPLLRGRAELLASHQGYDPGALALARTLARGLGAPLVANRTTRLLVDVNRSRRSRALFPPWIRALPDAVRDELIGRYHRPYRDRVERRVAALVAQGNQVVHLSVHSFTPVLDGRVRQADLGLLYDPSRAAEKCFCRDFSSLVRQHLTSCRVRYNYPYRGNADGLTRTLRKRFAQQDYIGIELEANQALLSRSGRFPSALSSCLLDSLLELIPVD